MDPMSLAIGGGAQLLGGYLAGEAQKEAANKAYAAQKESMIKMREMLEAIGIPSIEAQKIVLEAPEYAGDLIVENLGPSAMEEIQLDPRLKSAQMDALRQLQEQGEVGLTAEDRAEREELLRQAAAQGQAAQKGILQDMAQRGTLDSGASLIAQLQAQAQQGADARRQSEQLAADVASRRRDAIARAANLASGMESSDFGRQSQIASAKDRIQQFNVANRMRGQERNLDARQRQAALEAQLKNQAQLHNKALLQQDYQNRMAKAQTMAGVESQMGNAAAQRAQQMGSAQAGMYSGMGSAIGSGAMAYGKAQHEKGLANIKAGNYYDDE